MILRAGWRIQRIGSTILFIRPDKRCDQNTVNVDPGADGKCEWDDGWRAALEERNKIERNKLQELLLGKGPREEKEESEAQEKEPKYKKMLNMPEY